MHALNSEQWRMVAGGLSEIDQGSGGDWGGHITYDDYWDTHAPDYEIQAKYDGSAQITQAYRDSASMLASAAGWGVGSVVTGACILAPALLSGPAAPEVAALLSRPCAVIGTAAGIYTGIWVGGKLAARFKLIEN